MAIRRSMARNQNHDNEASSSRKRPKSWAPWSDLDHNGLNIIMMLLGVVDFLSFSGVCKSWRSLALLKRDMLMASIPPMSITISRDANEKECYLKDVKGRKFKTILPDFSGGGECVGVTCGYLIFFSERFRDFWLVNPITRKQLHFPHFPTDYYYPNRVSERAILVFSPSTSGLVFVVLCMGEIWYSVEGKGAWKHVSYGSWIQDICAFKGKIYALNHGRGGLCELGLNRWSEFTLHETKNPLSSKLFIPKAFVRAGENLFVIGGTQDDPYSLRELDFGEMEWVTPCEKTMDESSFFFSFKSDDVVAVKQESWTDPLSQSNGGCSLFLDNNRICRCLTMMMWYFPHESIDVDRIDY